MSAPPPPPKLSPDGRFYWDGARWLPIPTAMSRQPPPLYSPDGRNWWNGASWVPVLARGAALPKQSHLGRNLALVVGGLLILSFILAAIGSAPKGSSSVAAVKPTATAAPKPTPTLPPSPTPTLAPSPTPSPVLPEDAWVRESHTWVPGTNSLGDPIVSVGVDITTNIPHRFLASIFLIGRDTQAFPSKDCSGAIGPCAVYKRLHGDFTCTSNCSKGFDLDMYICSYKAPLETDPNGFSTCPDQDDTYLTYIGPLGANLAGNPAAKHNAYHPAILELSYHFHVGPP